MQVGQDGVAIITLANPPVNALHPKGTHPKSCCCPFCQCWSDLAQSIFEFLLLPGPGAKRNLDEVDGGLQCYLRSSTMPERLTTVLM